MDDVEKNKAQNKEKRHTPEFSDEKIQIPETEEVSRKTLVHLLKPAKSFIFMCLDKKNPDL